MGKMQELYFVMAVYKCFLVCGIPQRRNGFRASKSSLDMVNKSGFNRGNLEDGCVRRYALCLLGTVMAKSVLAQDSYRISLNFV